MYIYDILETFCFIQFLKFFSSVFSISVFIENCPCLHCHEVGHKFFFLRFQIFIESFFPLV